MALHPSRGCAKEPALQLPGGHGHVTNRSCSSKCSVRSTCVVRARHQLCFVLHCMCLVQLFAAFMQHCKQTALHCCLVCFTQWLLFGLVLGGIYAI